MEIEESIKVKMRAMWEKEGRPAYILFGGTQYQVYQDGKTKKFEFTPMAQDGYYGSVSFSSGAK